jgi:D-alanyl-D-alanine carboxypeptidase (penicillin-binding protein 5/6)
VEDLIMGMVVQSGNDATVALAEFVAGSEDTFVELMNREAEKLGLAGSHFVNSTGLPHPEHHMTARDIATLIRAIIKEFPDQYPRYSVREFSYNNITQYNRNQLLWRDASVDGVKTGHTRSAGYCLSASAKRGDTRLISVVLGADKSTQRFSATESLFNYGFRFFETHRLYQAGKALSQIRVWKGERSEIDVGAAEDFYVTVAKGRYEELNASLNINSNSLEAPVQKGVPVGSVSVALGDETVAEAQLVTLQDVTESGFVGRIVDGLLMTVSSWFD